MNTKDRTTDLIQPGIESPQNDLMNHEGNPDIAYDLYFMDRMYDAATDMTADDWDACLP